MHKYTLSEHSQQSGADQMQDFAELSVKVS